MPCIYLIPNTLGESPNENNFPSHNIEVIRSIRHFAVESEKSARKFLKSVGVMPPFEGIQLHLLDKRTRPQELSAILQAAGSQDIGILSEAGCPGIADPGSNLVLAGHEKGYEVVPLVGPSSILLAIMASGLNGQNFTFHGYLPISGNERLMKLREIEDESAISGTTHVFIETPFRNEHLLADILKACKQNTMLSIACELTLPTQQIKTQNIDGWRRTPIELRNRATVFSLLGARYKRKKD